MIRAVPNEKSGQVDSRRTEERFERRLASFESLFRLVEKLGATFDATEIARLVAAFMEERGVKRAALYTLALENRRLEPQIAGRSEEHGALPRVPLESAFVRWLSEEHGSVLLEEFTAAGPPGADDEKELRFLVEAGFSRAIALRVGDELLGMLVYGGIGGGEDSPGCDDGLCAMVARAASISIRNASIRREIESSMRELERFSAAKRDLIAGVAQDIRMPLAFLKNAIWSLEPDREGEGILVDMAKSEVIRLEKKIEYVLSLGDIESRPCDFDLEPADVSSIVEDILREKLPEIEEKQVRIDLDDRARFRKALIAPGKLAIAIRSLIDNAVRAAERDGTVAVTIRASGEPPGPDDGIAVEDRWANTRDASDPRATRNPRSPATAPYLVIEVRDEGSAAFDRFGSDLVISQRVVSGHGGRLLYTGAGGEGARFSIWIPLDT
jgi:K+-sensing histidine kinase KdpD